MSPALADADCLPYSLAKDLGDRVVAELAPHCARIELVGSIRRQRPEIGDVDILAIPAWAEALFGEFGKDTLTTHCAALVKTGRLLRGRICGPRAKVFRLPAAPKVQVEVFAVLPETWGVQMAIRTGPAAFSRALVTEVSRGGLLADGLRVREGRLESRQTGELFDTPEEEDFMVHCGGWLPPQQRRWPQ